MNKFTTIILIQLRPINLLIKPQTLFISSMKSYALARRIRISTFIDTVGERSSRILVSGLGIVAWNFGEARDCAYGITDDVGWLVIRCVDVE